MSFFSIPKRKIFEVGFLIFFNIISYFLWKSWDFIVLFSFGFIWNWVAAQEGEVSYGNTRRYRFSTLKTVFNLQNLFLRPVRHLPLPVLMLVKILPAGLFWSAVILFNESDMPYWAVFLGSLAFELMGLEHLILNSKEQKP
jgi:hypothetical protein